MSDLLSTVLIIAMALVLIWVADQPRSPRWRYRPDPMTARLVGGAVIVLVTAIQIGKLLS